MFGLQAIYTDARVIHSGSAQTGLCVHFAGTGLLNQQWETYTHGHWDLHSAHSHSAGCLPHAHTHSLTPTNTRSHTHRWTLCLCPSQTNTHTETCPTVYVCNCFHLCDLFPPPALSLRAADVTKRASFVEGCIIRCACVTQTFLSAFNNALGTKISHQHNPPSLKQYVQTCRWLRGIRTFSTAVSKQITRRPAILFIHFLRSHTRTKKSWTTKK